MGKISCSVPDFDTFMAYLGEKGYISPKFSPQKLYDELKFYGLHNPDGSKARGWKSCVGAWWKVHKPLVRAYNKEQRQKEKRKAMRDQRNKIRKERAWQRHLDWEDTHKDYYRAYTDGSCGQKGKSYGAGGSAYVVLKDGELLHEASIGKECTTSNRMEVLAIVSVVNWLPPHSKVVIYSDSEYAIRVLSGQWKPKKNLDLVEMYNRIVQKHDKVEFSWVKGHNGNYWNEYVDQLATKETAKMKMQTENV